MRFYTASKLGSKRAYTKEGFLACLDVPIARTGEMIYAGAELPELEASRDGLIRVQRNAEEVFRAEALASFVGKPTTNDHPPEMVGPTNYSRYSKGSTQNVRQGQGIQADLMIADLMFCDPITIKAIESGKDEISCGYDAEYEFIAPGIYRQVGITGNHVALVDEGRCGARCAIGDSAAALQSTVAGEAVARSNGVGIPLQALRAAGSNGAGIALRNSRGELLFMKRVGAAHAGTWCFPGGKVDLGETVEQAARRELSEEAGLKAGPLRLVDERPLSLLTTFSTFVGDVDGADKPTLNDEHDAFRWAAPDAAPQPLHPGVAATLREKASALKASPAAQRAPASDSAPSCGCGGGRHHHDAKPARPRKRKTNDMATRTKVKGSNFDRLRRLFAAKDEAGFEEALNETQEAVEATQEEQDQAEFAKMIGSAVAEAIAPIAARLDDVDSFIADRKSKDAEAERRKAEAAANDRRSRDEMTDEEKAAKEAAEKEAAEKATKDSADLAAFLASKGLSEGDVAACLAMIKKDEPTTNDDGSTGPGYQSGMGGTAQEMQGTTGSGATGDPGDMAGQGSSGAGTNDSVALLAEFRDTVSKAEILAPGVKLPVYDAKAKAKSTADSICALRRRALRSAFDSAGKVHVSPFVTDAAPDFSKMTCDAIKHAFAGASELAKRANAPTIRVGDAGFTVRDAGVRGTIAAMNAAAKDLWKPAAR